MENETLIRRRITIAQRRLAAARLLCDYGFINDVLSKSYYAIFAAAKAILASKDLNSKKHAGVVELFNLHFIKPGLIDKRFSKILIEAKQARELSDYGDFYETDEQECQVQLQNAAQFIEMAMNFLRAQGLDFTSTS